MSEYDIIAAVIAVRIAYLQTDSTLLEIDGEFKEVFQQEYSKVNNHILHFALDHYADDPNRWFKFLNTIIVPVSPQCRRVLFTRLALFSPRLLTPEHLFALIDHSKTQGGVVINDIGTVLLNYIDYPVPTMQLVFFWIEHGLIWNIGPVEQYLHQMVEANPIFITEYLSYYRTWYRSSARFGYPPILFEALASSSPMTAIQGLNMFDPDNSMELCAILEISRKILGCCYRYETYESYSLEMQALYRFLVKIGSFSPPTKRGIPTILTTDLTKWNNYQNLTNTIEAMISQLGNIPKPFDVMAMCNVLNDYPTLTRVATQIVDKAEGNTRGLPFLNLLMSASLPNDDINVDERTHARAILDILEHGSAIFVTPAYDRNSTITGSEKKLRDILGDRDRFWPLFSEFLLYIRFEQCIRTIEPTFGDKSNLDLELALGDARVILEIKAPRQDQTTKMSNGANYFNGRVQYAIIEKILHLSRSGAASFVVREPKTFYLIAIDITDLPLRWIDVEKAIEKLTPPSKVDGEIDIRQHLKQVFNGIEDADMIYDSAPLVSGFIFYSLRSIEEGKPFVIDFKVIPNPLTSKHLPVDKIQMLVRLLNGEAVT